MTVDINNLQDLGNPLRDLKKTFDESIIPHRPSLWRYCYQLTGSPWDAEDLVQETLIKAFSSLAQLWQPINPKGYLFKIASNTWIDQCRKVKIKMDSFEYHNEPSYEKEDLSGEVEEAMERLVLHLPPRQRVVLLLVEVFGFKAKEVGEIFGATEGAIKALLNRARVRLKEIQLNEEGFNQLAISEEQRNTISLFIESFNRRDPDGIAKLLDENVSNDIVHIAQEFGKDTVRSYSLTDWAKDPVEMKAEVHILWGKPTIVQIGEMNNCLGVYNLNLIEIDSGRIITVKDYYFCPELLKEAAKELQLSVFSRNYVM
ncbi:RNA polymerase sigma factor [Bacillus sp. 31A1R]|uniref:RNA polymerase sigma factor n=1 Tax=Robertmurraya mangrovi TaxID=3098077 RepID=A0ABU5IVZ0_9BACI|nr:RNA polymerase sigma factor [Bacillus sp. 31A1R]MDZ5471307.1 RNA polymerase sigma factor [Bacillus sp. 31A1R]